MGEQSRDRDRQTFQAEEAPYGQAQECTEGEQEVCWSMSGGRSWGAGGWEMRQGGGTSWLVSGSESDTAPRGLTQRMARLVFLREISKSGTAGSNALDISKACCQIALEKRWVIVHLPRSNCCYRLFLPGVPFLGTSLPWSRCQLSCLLPALALSQAPLLPLPP